VIALQADVSRLPEIDRRKRFSRIVNAGIGKFVPFDQVRVRSKIRM
jgi:hypothetical protein